MLGNCSRATVDGVCSEQVVDEFEDGLGSGNDFVCVCVRTCKISVYELAMLLWY